MQRDGPQNDHSIPAQAAQVLRRDTVVNIAGRRSARGANGAPLRCVSSGYLTGGCSCDATIPAAVVAAAWSRRRRSGVSGDGFFHFSHEDEVWLAYGLRDGRIRGVYCPEHRAERDLRCSGGEAGAHGPSRPAERDVVAAGA